MMSVSAPPNGTDEAVERLRLAAKFIADHGNRAEYVAWTCSKRYPDRGWGRVAHLIREASK